MKKSKFIKLFVYGALFTAFIFLSLKCTGQSNANFKTIGADTIKPREERLGGYNKLFLKKPDNIYVNVETQNADSSLRNWVKNIASGLTDTTNFVKYSDTLSTIGTRSYVTKNFIPYSDTVVKVLTPWNSNFQNYVRYKNDTIFSKFNSSIAVGNGLTKQISGTNNSALGTQSLYSLTTGSSNLGIGGFSLRNLTTGSGNVSVGYAASQNLTTGQYNVIAGGGAFFFGNGVGNIFIGRQSGYGYSNKGLNQNYSIKIGYESGRNDTISNRLFIESSNSQTPLIGGKFDLDQLGVNMPIGNTWNYTFNVGGEMGATKVNVSDTTGSVTTTVPTKRWVLDRVGATGFPYTQTLTNNVDWGGLTDFTLNNNNISFYGLANVLMTVGGSYVGVETGSVLIGSNGSTSISVISDNITVNNLKGVKYNSHNTNQNPLWITDKFYVDSTFNNYMRKYEPSGNQDTSTTHSKIFYGRQSVTAGLEDNITFVAVDGAGQKMQIQYAPNQDVFYARGWNNGGASWNPWYVLGGKSVDQHHGNGGNVGVIVGVQDSISGTGVRIQRAGKYLFTYDLKYVQRDCGWNNSWEIQNGVRRWNNTPQNMRSSSYVFQASPAIITGDKTVLDTHATFIVDCQVGDYFSIYGHSPTTPGFTGSGNVYTDGAFLTVTELR